MRRILLVDDEMNVLHALQRGLRQIFMEDEIIIEICTDPIEAANKLGVTEYDCVISDFRMPRMDGIDFLRIAKEIQPDTVRIMLSASTESQTVVEAVNEAEVFRYLTKPWDALELSEKIRSAFAHRDALNGERAQAISPQEAEAERLENMEPGITKVNWGPGGAVIPE